MTETDTITLNLMDDVWTALHLTPEAITAPVGEGRLGLFVLLTDAEDPLIRYYLDNNRNSLPDGVGLRARYGAPDGPTVFSVNNHTGEPVAWQQKAVEPLLVALREHMADVRSTAA